MPWMQDALTQCNIYSFNNYRLCRTSQFLYQLDSLGRIWIKSHNQATPFTIYHGKRVSTKPGWHLFEGTGITQGKFKRPLLKKTEKIIAIQVASELIIAVSNYRNVFIYKPTDKQPFGLPIIWKKKIGQPVRSNLKIPNNARAFTFSVSIGKTLSKRTHDIMGPTDITLYGQDGAGIKHESGHCSTLYVVNNDGRVIYYWDTGLASGSMQRAILSPLDGTTQIQCINAAGSTILVSVIDCSNKLRFFKKHFDYENDGQAPGFNYSYSSNDAHKKPGPHVLGHGTRVIPCDTWTEIPVSNIYSLISSRVDIEMTGQGENARLIKIFGVDINNQTGIYSKNLEQVLHDIDTNTTSNWHFTPVAISMGEVLPKRVPYPYISLEPIQKTYHSYVYLNNKYIKISLINFHPFNSAENTSYLVFTDIDNNEALYINIKSIDGWGFHYLATDQEELIASIDGIDKFYSATIITPPNLTSQTSPLARIIQQYFLPYNMVFRAINIIANNERLTLESTDKKLSMQFSRIMPNEEHLAGFYLKRAHGLISTHPQNKLHCLELIKDCDKLIGYLKSVHRDVRTRSLGFYLGYKIGQVGRKSALPLSRVGFLAHRITRVVSRCTHDTPAGLPVETMGKKALHDLKPAFRYNAQICKKAALQENTDFKEAIEIIEGRKKQLILFYNTYFDAGADSHLKFKVSP